MYEGGRRGKKPEPSHDIKKIYFVVGGIISTLLIAVAFFVFYQNRTIRVAEPPSLEDCMRTIEGFKEGGLEVIVCMREDGTLILLWENVPEGTSQINIYRADRERGEWGLWRSIPVGETSGGVEIGIQGPGDFTYYLETARRDGTATWRSENAPEEPSGASGTGTAPTGSISEPPSPPPAPRNGTPPSLPPPPSPPQSGGSGEEGVYYTPQGEIISTSTIDLGDFWVQHVHQRIELGWKNLSDGTDKIVIDRSKTQTGGYKQLLQIDNPNQSDFIRIVDETIDQDYYYKMEALQGTSILEVYGPVLLPHL